MHNFQFSDDSLFWIRPGSSFLCKACRVNILGFNQQMVLGNQLRKIALCNISAPKTDTVYCKETSDFRRKTKQNRKAAMERIATLDSLLQHLLRVDWSRAARITLINWSASSWPRGNWFPDLLGWCRKEHRKFMKQEKANSFGCAWQ